MDRMAIVECKECGSKVSDKAKVCPSCGIESPSPKKPASRIVRYGGSFVAVIIIWSAFFGTPKNSQPNSTASGGSIDRLSMAQATAEAIKRLARDPDSVKIEHLLISEDGKIQCIQYRAKNGFGGMNREFIVMIGDNVSKSMADWTNSCQESFTDYSSRVW